ncbi:MAG: DUF4199 domain-containing protein [Acidobacteriia bacterium]|nr:DUF4199 domain-containing protein [Terriglobia bacterium]
MTMNTFQWKPAVAIGLVSGLIQVAIGVALYLAGIYFARGSLLVTLLALAASIAVGTRYYGRHVLDGHTTYWSALLVGFIIAVCTGLVYVTYNIVSISFVYPHFLEDMVQSELARQQALGMDPSQAGQMLELLRDETTLRRIVTENLSGFVRFGVALSALTAIAFRRRTRARNLAGVR